MRSFPVVILFLAVLCSACSHIPQGVNGSCITRVQEYKVLGHSLDGVINHTDVVRVLEGYENCNTLKENDVVLFLTDIRPNPIIKIIRAVPGDNLTLVNYTLIKNGAPMLDMNNTPYRISARSTHFLEPYLRDHPVVPNASYFLLGTDPHGGLDSSQLGYVPVNSIIGIADCCGRFSK